MQFLVPVTDYYYVMEILYSAKIFDIEFLPDLYVFGSSEPKKVVLENLSVRMWEYTYICAWVCGEYPSLYEGGRVKWGRIYRKWGRRWK